MKMNLTNGNDDPNRILLLQKILFCPAEERTLRELQQLPKPQREQVWADMTGNLQAVAYRVHAEQEEFLRERIKHLNYYLKMTTAAMTAKDNNPNSNSNSNNNNNQSVPTWLQQHNSPTCHAFDLAVEQDAQYVERQKLKFLRADDFDAQAAATRLIHHFAMKQDLFGSHCLGRDIILNDLSEDDLRSLRAGGMQLLPLQDHASRGVIFTRHSNYQYKDRKNILRAFFYTSCCAVEIEHYQKVGFISVSYQVGGGYPHSDDGGYDFELTRAISQLVKCMPLRFVAIYVCFNASPWKNVADLISHLVSPLLRVRLRSLQGSHQECLYQLMALGIPHSAVPVTNEGTSILTPHLKWIASRYELEQKQRQQENPGQE